MRKATGFTLIELLVVIAIIAILAAILFPVFAKALEKAREKACLSNTKQMAVAVQMYAQDYDEKMAPAYGATVRFPRTDGRIVNTTVWYGLLHPYVMNAAIYLCPSAVEPAYASVSNYGINLAITPPTAGNSIKLGEIKYPSETIVIADSAYDPLRPNTSYLTNSWRIRHNNWNRSTFIPARHNGGANIAFCDGHAKWHNIALNPNPDMTTTAYPLNSAFTLPPRDICWEADGRPKYTP